MSGGDIVYGGTYTNGIVLSNPATQNPATIAATGLVTNTGTAIYGEPVAAWNVSNFGTVEGTGTAGAGIALAAGGSIDNAGLISGFEESVLIGGAAGGSITNNASGTINGSVTFANGAGMVANSGSIAGAASLNAGGIVTNDSGGTINLIAIANGIGTVVNSGAIKGGFPGGISLADGGSITNAQGAMINGGASILGPFPAVLISGGAGTLVNSGTLTGGIFLSAGGSVANNYGAYMGSDIGLAISGGAGTVVNAGTISDSVNLYDGGAVTNLGTITVVEGGLRHPFIYSAVGFYAAGTLTNLGTIATEAGFGSPVPNGVSLAAGGIVDNGAPGSRSALISGYYMGILAYGSSTIVNDGRIAATGSYGLGVYLGGGDSTLVNAGRIAGAGGAAAYVTGSYSTLVADPGAVFIGRVAASGTYDILELGAGSHAGRLAGLGTKFSGFAVLGVDPGAVWNLSGSAPGTYVDNNGVIVVRGDTLALGPLASDAGYRGVIRIAADGTAAFAGAVGPRERVTFRDGTGTMQLDFPLSFKGAVFGFRSGDTIDLVNTAANGVSIAAHHLAVINNGATVADLHLFGTFTAADFALSPDGHGGTDITLVPPDPLAMKA